MGRENTTQVVAAVIRKDDTYLICQRPSNKRHGELWEFPGGKVLKNESFIDAICRELEEELNLIVSSVGETLYVSDEINSQFVIHFIEIEAANDPILKEHKDLKWANKQQIREFDLAPSDKEFVFNFFSI